MGAEPCTSIRDANVTILREAQAGDEGFKPANAADLVLVHFEDGAPDEVVSRSDLARIRGAEPAAEPAPVVDAEAAKAPPAEGRAPRFFGETKAAEPVVEPVKKPVERETQTLTTHDVKTSSPQHRTTGPGHRTGGRTGGGSHR